MDTAHRIPSSASTTSLVVFTGAVAYFLISTVAASTPAGAFMILVGVFAGMMRLAVTFSTLVCASAQSVVSPVAACSSTEAGPRSRFPHLGDVGDAEFAPSLRPWP